MKLRKNNENTKYFVISFTLFAIYAFLLTIIFTPGLMVNDDVAMMSFANGDFTGEPEIRLIFIGPLVAGLLFLLYEILPSIPWYALLLVSLPVFSSALLVTTVCRFKRCLFSRQVIGIVALLIIQFPVLVLDMTFSTTAMYCSIAGIFSAVIFLFDYDTRLRSVHFMSIIVTSLLALSLRPGFFGISVILFAPMALTLITKPSKKMIRGATLMLSLALATFAIETYFSNTGEWSTFNEFNRVRGSLHGTPSFGSFVDSAYDEKTIERIRSFGWESEDLLLFGSWYFENPEIFNIETLKKLSASIEQQSAALPFQPALENIFFGREFFIFVGLLTLLYGIQIQNRRQRLFLLAQLVWFGVVVIYVSSNIRFPDRIALGAISGLFICLLIASYLLNAKEDQIRQREENYYKTELAMISILAFLSALVIPHKFSANEISKRNEYENEVYRRDISTLNKISNNGVYVSIGVTIAAEGINPWNNVTILEDHNFLGLGWITQSPHQEKRKASLDLSGDLIEKIWNRSDRFLITTSEITSFLKTSYERRQKINLTFRQVEKLSNGTVIYSVEGKPQ